MSERLTLAGFRNAGPAADDDDARADDALDEPGDDLPLTDYGHAQRIVADHGRDMMYVPGMGRYAWCGTHWQADHCGQWVRFAKATARQLPDELEAQGLSSRDVDKLRTRAESLNGMTAALTLAESEPGVAADVDALDADPWLLNVGNGTLDLRTGKLAPHDRRDRITKVIELDYAPDAPCPRFLRFMAEIQPAADMRAYVQRQAGYAATGVVAEQELMIPWGGGANGKSALVDALMHALGPYAGTAPDSLLTARQFSEHPTELADLQGKRFVVASETEEDAKLRVQLVKKLTGDERIKARRMRQDYFEFRRTHKLWLVTNNKPRIDEGTHAIWRRLRLVPFNVTIPADKRDPHLLGKLKDEAAGILAWIVRGCLDWQRDGMRPPAAVLEATRQYECESDRLADYRDRLAFGDGLRVTRADLFDDYLAFAKSAGEHDRLTDRAFYGRVRVIQGVEEKTWKPVGESVPVRGFTGVDLAWKHGKGADDDAR